jgi:hypothetical protein
MNNDLKKIMEWRAATDKVLSEENGPWVVFIEDDDVQNGESSTLLAYSVPENELPEGDKVSEDYRDDILNSNYESKQVEVWFENGEASSSEDVMFLYVD